ncbi:hypothetical protein [Anabaena azotica]|uniref:Uncharacterized protein n=1 Tax=Anabaena azotica FACHB-119 TaxID=947527 RepID=A0ABR8DCD9_9NOST|nr:hypothetical protein [Anabaena azotica]MBD2503887.1 hypothetical protein [Anabaena azotica FACHB-119]
MQVLDIVFTGIIFISFSYIVIDFLLGLSDLWDRSQPTLKPYYSSFPMLSSSSSELLGLEEKQSLIPKAMVS